MDLIGTNISQSGFELVFESEGNTDLYHQTPREKKVKSWCGVMCIMVDNRQTDNAFCDIAPLPLSDSYVDAQDPVALAEYFYNMSLRHF